MTTEIAEDIFKDLLIRKRILSSEMFQAYLIGCPFGEVYIHFVFMKIAILAFNHGMSFVQYPIFDSCCDPCNFKIIDYSLQLLTIRKEDKYV